jgi:hypothetical protein
MLYESIVADKAISYLSNKKAALLLNAALLFVVQRDHHPERAICVIGRMSWLAALVFLNSFVKIY